MLSLSNYFSFFFCFGVICLALWSQPGSGPRISPQRHNYHTGLNVPPTSYSTHQRPSILSPSPLSSDAFGLSRSIIRILFTLPVCSSSIPCFPLLHYRSLSWCPSFLRQGEDNGINAPDGSVSEGPQTELKIAWTTTRALSLSAVAYI